MIIVEIGVHGGYDAPADYPTMRVYY